MAAFGLIFLGYLTARAVLIPVTHDEANTFMQFVVLPVMDIVAYTNPVPNNHIFHTLLVKFFTTWFGTSALTVRLPNLLGFVLFYTTAVLLLRRLSPRPLFTFFGLTLLLCNHYFVDFFSLARGYALSVSFLMDSVFAGVVSLQERRNAAFVAAILLSAVAVYTNFTALNVYVALQLVLFLGLLQESRFRITQTMLKLFAVAAVINIVLAAVSYWPITRMVATNQFVYWGTNGFYADTVLPLVQSSVHYNGGYFRLPVSAFADLFIAAFFVSFVALFFLRLKPSFLTNPVGFFYGLMIGTVAVNILQFHLISTPYLNSRTALSFYFLAALYFIGFAGLLFRAGAGYAPYWSLPLAALFVFHFGRAANLSSCFEWRFDAENYKVLDYVQQHRQPRDTLVLDTHWLMYPSLAFHTTATKGYEGIRIAPFHIETHPHSPHPYYYAQREETTLLDPLFSVVQVYGDSSRFLMKRKETNESAAPLQR